MYGFQEIAGLVTECGSRGLHVVSRFLLLERLDTLATFTKMVSGKTQGVSRFLLTPVGAIKVGISLLETIRVAV